MSTHHFIVSLCVYGQFSSLLLPISRSLQAPSVDLIECMVQVNDVKCIFKRYHEGAEEEFTAIFNQAIEIPQKASYQIHHTKMIQRHFTASPSLSLILMG